MFKLKSPTGTNNLIGEHLKEIRVNMNPPLSQRKLAQKLQILGYDVDNHMIRRIETGERYVTDIEIKALAQALHVTYQKLIDG